MKPAPFEYYAPASVAEALQNLTDLGYSGKVLAGGQSLIPAMNFRMAQPQALVDIIWFKRAGLYPAGPGWQPEDRRHNPRHRCRAASPGEGTGGIDL